MHEHERNTNIKINVLKYCQHHAIINVGYLYKYWVNDVME